jgi:hypothetical protein
MISGSFVSLLFFNAGVSISNEVSLTVKSSLTNIEYYKQHIIGFVLSLIGLAIQLFWKNVYGAIIKESRTFQIATYIDWVLPAFNPILLLITNKSNKYFFNEASFLLKQNAKYLYFSVMTILLIYFSIFYKYLTIKIYL